MAAVRDLHDGADVYSSDGHKLGRLSRVVLRAADFSATQVVVDIGFLRAGHKLWEGGLGLEYDRVVPIEAVARATDERIDLSLTAAAFKDAPEYSIESFEPVDLRPDASDPPPLAESREELARRLAGRPADTGVYLVQRFNKSLDDVDIREGTRVWRMEPHEQLGEVDRVLFDGGGRATAFVIRRGWLLKRDVVLPVRFVSEVLDDLVRVEMSDADVEGLEGFEA
jgi:uncharacterized protein YrrD